MYPVSIIQGVAVDKCIEPRATDNRPLSGCSERI